MRNYSTNTKQLNLNFLHGYRIFTTTCLNSASIFFLISKINSLLTGFLLQFYEKLLDFFL